MLCLQELNLHLKGGKGLTLVKESGRVAHTFSFLILGIILNKYTLL